MNMVKSVSKKGKEAKFSSEPQTIRTVKAMTTEEIEEQRQKIIDRSKIERQKTQKSFRKLQETLERTRTTSLSSLNEKKDEGSDSKKEEYDDIRLGIEEEREKTLEMVNECEKLQIEDLKRENEHAELQINYEKALQENIVLEVKITELLNKDTAPNIKNISVNEEANERLTKEQNKLINELKLELELEKEKNAKKQAVQGEEEVTKKDRAILTTVQKNIIGAKTRNTTALTISIISAIAGAGGQIPFIANFSTKYPIVQTLSKILGVGGMIGAAVVTVLTKQSISKAIKATTEFTSQVQESKASNVHPTI